MFNSPYGMIAGVGVVIAVAGFSAGDRFLNYKSTEATVFVIDRTCDFTETKKYSTGKKTVDKISGRCSLTDEFEKMQKGDSRSKRISGKMVAKVNYIAPQDGAPHTSSIEFDGGDDEFYSMKAGDTVQVLVDNNDLDKVRLD